MHQDKSDIKFNKYNIESCILTPIEQVLMLNTKEDRNKLRLEREIFLIDTLDTLEPQGLNRKRSEDIVKNSQNGEILPLVAWHRVSSKNTSCYIMNLMNLRTMDHNGDLGSNTTQYYNFITTFIRGLLRDISRQDVSSKPFLRRE